MKKQKLDRLEKIIKNELTYTYRPFIMKHHNREFLNAMLEKYSSESIEAYKAGTLTRNIILPIDLNDENMKKIANIPLFTPLLCTDKAIIKEAEFRRHEYIIPRIQSNYAIAKAIGAAVDLADNNCLKNPNYQRLLVSALSYYNKIEDAYQIDPKDLPSFNFSDTKFKEFCEEAFGGKNIHLAFTNVHNLSRETQTELNAYVALRMRTPRFSIACGREDLKTLATDRDGTHRLQQTHDVDFFDIDRLYWDEYVYEPAQYDYPAQSFEDWKRYLNELKEAYERKAPTIAPLSAKPLQTEQPHEQ